MIFIAICVIIALIMIISDYVFEWYEKIFISFLGILCGVLIGFLIWVSVGSLVGFILPKEEFLEKQEIYALNDGSTFSGHYYLASGYIEEKAVIKYISDGEFGNKIYTANVDNTYINEGYSDAYVEIHKTDFKYEWFWWFAMDWKPDVYVFYVPSGSVTNEINIDLK